MRLLLDTCTFLWMFGRTEGLSRTVRSALEDIENEVFLSAVTPWEILIKVGKGKLRIDTGGAPIEQFLSAQRRAHGVSELPVSEADVCHVIALPAVHHDPFDRLLICQAIEHGLTLVTPDPFIRKYPIRSLW